VPNNSNEADAVAADSFENSRHLPKGVPNNSNEADAVAADSFESSRHRPKGG